MKKCLVCNAEFTPVNKKGVFCSKKCKQKDYRNNVAKLLKQARANKDVPEKAKPSEDKQKAVAQINAEKCPSWMNPTQFKTSKQKRIQDILNS